MREKGLLTALFLTGKQGGLDKLPVEAGDIGDRDLLGAGGLAFPFVTAVAESQLIHLLHHGQGPLGPLWLALREQGQLRDLGPDKEHGRAVGAGSDTGAAADALRGVQGLVGGLLGDGDGVGLDGPAGVDRDVAAFGDQGVKGAAIHHQVFDQRKGAGAEGLDDDGVAVFEVPHMELTEGGALLVAVGLAVDHGPAHAADPFPAVMVKGHGLFALAGQPLVDHVEHLKKGHVGGDGAGVAGLKGPGGGFALLSPDLQFQVDGLVGVAHL